MNVITSVMAVNRMLEFMQRKKRIRNEIQQHTLQILQTDRTYYTVRWLQISILQEKKRGVRMKRYKKPKNSVKYELTPKEIKQIKYDVTKEATQKSVLLVIAAAQEVKALTEDDICEIFETVSRWVNFMDGNLIKLKDVQEVIERKTGVKLKGWK